MAKKVKPFKMPKVEKSVTAKKVLADLAAKAPPKGKKAKTPKKLGRMATTGGGRPGRKKKTAKTPEQLAKEIMAYKGEE